MQHKARWRAVAGSSVLALLFFLVFTYSLVSAVGPAPPANEGPPHTPADDWFYPVELNDVSAWADAVGIGDFNGDGLADVAVGGCYQLCALHILWQNGAGELIDSGQSYSYTGGGASNLIVADFDDDGREDIAITQEQGDAAIRLFYQGADSHFTTAAYGSNYFPQAITAGDFNHDGLTDLAASFCAPVMGVYLQDETPTTAPTRSGISSRTALAIRGPTTRRRSTGARR